MTAGIRSARARDLDGLVAIENAAFSLDRLSRRSLRRLLGSRSAAILVAEDRPGRPTGYAVVLCRRGSAVARLYSLAVSPGHCGAGLGRRLLEAAEEAAVSLGKPVMRLEVREENARAIALYEGCGYRRIGRRRGYYEDGAAALRLEKTLPVEAPAASGRSRHGPAAALAGDDTAR